MSLDAIEKRLKSIEDAVDSTVKKLDEKRAAGISATEPAFKGSLGASSAEAKLLRTFRCKNLGELLRVNSCSPEFRHVSLQDKLTVINMKSHFDTARWVSQMFYGDGYDQGDLSTDSARIAHCKSILDTRYARSYDLGGVVKAFGSTTPGSGDEWVPTAISSTYVEEFELERKLVSAFRTVEMSTNPWELPVQTSVTQARLIAEGAAIADTSFGTAKVSFSASKFGEHFLLPEELNEDSAPAILQLARSEIIESQGRALENAVLNGDTTAPHMDADILAADSALKAWKGLRKTALAAGNTVDFEAAGVTKVKLDAMRNKGGKYFVDPSRLAWVFGPTGYHQSLAIDEVTTVDKAGQAVATILSGQLGAFRGIPIIVSEFVREDLNDAAVHSGNPAADIKSVVHLVNLDRWMMGRRRPLRIKVQPDARLEYDRWQLVSYQRCDFKPINASEPSSVLGIDVLV